MTTTTLSINLTHHLQKGSIKEHYQHFHQKTITRQEIVQNTKIIQRATDRKRLRIKESLLILQQSPSLNKQHEGFEGVLHLRPHLQSREPLLATQTTLHLPAGSLTDQRDDPDNTISTNLDQLNNTNTYSASNSYNLRPRIP